MVPVARPMATGAQVLLLAVLNGDGVGQVLLTVGQDVNPVLELAKEEEEPLRQPPQRQTQLRLQVPLPLVALAFGTLHGQRLVLYHTAASSLAV